MIKPHKSRTDLEVPAFVKEEWEKGGSASKDQMASLLMEVNWDKVTRLISHANMCPRVVPCRVLRHATFVQTDVHCCARDCFRAAS